MLCGSEEGTLTIWDLRQPAFPASYYTVHEKSSVSDIAFHRNDPTKLFTAAESGELFQWSHKAQPITERIDGQLTVVENENINPWLCGQRTKSRINVSVLAVAAHAVYDNCIDDYLFSLLMSSWCVIWKVSEKQSIALIQVDHV